MLDKLQKISFALKATQSQKSYNATLPVLIKVLAKLRGDDYLLQVGNQQIRSQSHKELQLGQRYWGEMGRSSVGHIMLKNLIAQPKILESFADAPLKFSLQDLSALGEKEEIIEGFREFLSQKLATAQSREEFLFLSNLLLGLKSGVLNLVIDKKDEILQIKRLGSKKVKFCAIMPLLGVIEGEIELFASSQSQVGSKALQLKVMYESTKVALDKNLYLLEGFEAIHITLDKSLKPLYEFKEALLDVRG